MYLEHFRLHQFPFSITPNTEFYCDLPSYQEALNILLLSLRSGEGFIKITGEVGSGKTLLCRLLLSHIKEEFYTVYIPNPDLSPAALLRAIAQELQIPVNDMEINHTAHEKIYEKLLQLHTEDRNVVIIIDEAQALSNESLETLRLLTNLETEKTKLLQIILFGQPELDEKLNQKSLRQIKQRISFSFQLSPLKKHDVNLYLCHRLAIAGYTRGTLFTSSAVKLLWKGSRGIPRLINQIAHKAMLVSYGKGRNTINRYAIQKALKETEAAFSTINVQKIIIALLISLGGLAIWLILKS